MRRATPVAWMGYGVVAAGPLGIHGLGAGQLCGAVPVQGTVGGQPT